MADGTAYRGRVGSCHILLKVLNLIGQDFFFTLTREVKPVPKAFGTDGTAYRGSPESHRD